MNVSTEPTVVTERTLEGAVGQPVEPVTGRMVDVCALTDLEPAVAVGARADGVQIALVRLPDGTVHAVDNRDPRTGTSTMARGIVGSKGDEPTLAAPLYKEVYSLRSGRCLSDPTYSLLTHPVEVRAERVLVLVRRFIPAGAQSAPLIA